MATEMVAVSKSGDIKGAQRNFVGECPEHGQVSAKAKLGHHGTVNEAAMKRLFPKEARESIWPQLTEAEQEVFKQALHGHNLPTKGQVRRWLQFANPAG